MKKEDYYVRRDLVLEQKVEDVKKNSLVSKTEENKEKKEENVIKNNIFMLSSEYYLG